MGRMVSWNGEVFVDILRSSWNYPLPSTPVEKATPLVDRRGRSDGCPTYALTCSSAMSARCTCRRAISTISVDANVVGTACGTRTTHVIYHPPFTHFEAEADESGIV